MEKIALFFFITIILALAGYSQNEVEINREFTFGEGEYFGQKPPGLEPEIFAPGIVSEPETFEIGCTWSPDKKEFYFVRQTQKGGQMLCSRFDNNKWTAPAELEIFKKYPGFEPFISYDGKKFFYTRFALPVEMEKNPQNYTEKQKQDSLVNIWVMDKNEKELSEPQLCVPGMFCSASGNGNLYTTITTGDKQGIYKYTNENGKYSEKEFLSGGVNSPVMGAHPCISQDESFIIFDSKRKDDPEDADLYVCFMQKDGNWSEAFWLGDKINTRWNDICSSLSPDGKYLFYMSKADIYWVSTKIIEELKLKGFNK